MVFFSAHVDVHCLAASGRTTGPIMSPPVPPWKTEYFLGGRINGACVTMRSDSVWRMLPMPRSRSWR